MRIQSAKPALNEVDMTPMIDIVFQLIAFFMVITNFEQTQADERVILPKDQLAKPPEAKRADELTLNIGFFRDNDGNKTDPDPWVFFGDEKFRVLDTGPKLKQERNFYEAVGKDLKDVTVVIRADAEVPSGLIQELIIISQENGFQKFALKATQRVK